MRTTYLTQTINLEELRDMHSEFASKIERSVKKKNLSETRVSKISIPCTIVSTILISIGLAWMVYYKIIIEGRDELIKLPYAYLHSIPSISIKTIKGGPSIVFMVVPEAQKSSASISLSNGYFFERGMEYESGVALFLQKSISMNIKTLGDEYIGRMEDYLEGESTTWAFDLGSLVDFEEPETQHHLKFGENKTSRAQNIAKEFQAVWREIASFKKQIYFNSGFLNVKKEVYLR